MQTGMQDKFTVSKSVNQAYEETELGIIPEEEALVRQQFVPLPASYPIF
jgi:hypothetical protein